LYRLDGMDRKRTGLTKMELLWRLWSAAPEALALVVCETWLNDLLKDGLIPTGVRAGNDGRRPIYLYDAKTYRRARQILRFRHHDVRSRDSLSVLLFFNGYGVGSNLVREALAREWRRWSANVVGQVRSGYLNNHRSIPAKHKAALLRDLGPLDPALAEAGARLPPDLIIEAFRSAVQSPLAMSPLPSVYSDLTRAIAALRSDGGLAQLAMNAFAGVLVFDRDQPGSDPDGIEAVIANATSADLDLARQVSADFSFADPALFDLMFGEQYADGDNRLARRIRRTVRNEPAFAALMLVIGLRMAPVFGGLGKTQLQMIRQLMKEPGFLELTMTGAANKMANKT
jgi:hypothetical protein